MFIEELISGINLEDKNIEFKGMIEEGKKADGRNKEIGWLKTLAAFANTDGGRLYVGVEDKTHKILALDHATADKTIRLVHRQIKERFEPVIDYDINTIAVSNTLPTRYILEVSVPASKSLPVTVHEEGLLGIYIREYGQTNIATPEQIREMILNSDNIPYDSAFTEYKYKSEEYVMLRKYAENGNSQVLTDKALISIGFMNTERCLSKGALLFKDDCHDLRTKITATLWPGIDKGGSVILASEEFTGSLLDAINFAIKFVANHSANGFKKEATGQSEYIAYPPRSVMEGVVNAVGHRNYYIQGSQIELNVFKDRLELSSPGALLGVKTLNKEKNIAAIMPRRRNEVICAILALCHYMEEKGSGFDKIENDYKGCDDVHKPYISSDSSSFTLVLPDLTFHGWDNVASGELVDIHVDGFLPGKHDRRILAFCFEKSRSAKEIAELLGVSASTYFRKNTLQRLVDGQFLTAVRKGKITSFAANKKKVYLKG